MSHLKISPEFIKKNVTLKRRVQAGNSLKIFYWDRGLPAGLWCSLRPKPRASSGSESENNPMVHGDENMGTESRSPQTQSVFTFRNTQN